MSDRKIIIGSRGSELALWQANFVMEALQKLGVSTELKIIKTQGDKIQDLSFDKLEGKGFFTKELEDALLNGEIDLAVHSHKDLTTTQPPGLCVAAVSYREDPSELLLIRKESADKRKPLELKEKAVLGTSSARRKTQVLALRSDVEIRDLRGNVPTRIQKLRDGQYDAILLATAGVNRLKINLDEFYYTKLDPRYFVPAPAQGVLAYQVRESDDSLRTLLKNLHSAQVEKNISVERTVLNKLDGGCQLPLGIFCDNDEDADGNPVYKVWTVRSEKWDSSPVYLYHESSSTEGLAERIIADIHSVKPGSIFITRDERKFDQFVNVLRARDFKVAAHSLIDMVPVPFNEVPQTPWVFFSSKHAVKFFFDRKPSLPSGVKFGAISKATATEVRKFGYNCEFIGYSTDTRLTGKQFAARVGSEQVLFPLAKDSMRSIQRQFTKRDQALDLVVYETLRKDPGQLDPADVLVFTSPSNVETFLASYRISEHQKVVAMGDSTAASLKRAGYRVHRQPASFDDMGLLQAVFSVSQS